MRHDQRQAPALPVVGGEGGKLRAEATAPGSRPLGQLVIVRHQAAARHEPADAITFGWRVPGINRADKERLGVAGEGLRMES